MSAAVAAPSAASVRPAGVAWIVALALGLSLIGAGFVGSRPLPLVGWVTAFLFLAVASDVRSHTIPNVLTFPTLLIALFLSPWLGATGGTFEAALGAALGFALLVGPYAAGGVGAGDVKALMALGAWIGPAETLAAAVWALIIAGVLGLVLLAIRRELTGYARRWSRNLFTSLTLRRLQYEPPSPGSGAAVGIPFAAALAMGLSAQWLGGAPW